MRNQRVSGTRHRSLSVFLFRFFLLLKLNLADFAYTVVAFDKKLIFDSFHGALVACFEQLATFCLQCCFLLLERMRMQPHCSARPAKAPHQDDVKNIRASGIEEREGASLEREALTHSVGGGAFHGL